MLNPVKFGKWELRWGGCGRVCFAGLTEVWLCSGREYAESVGRKVRDLGMVVDLIFLNTEMKLMQALDDVSRGGSPFAIVITQQHQVHRSCTVNIMFGTPQGTEVSVCHVALWSL